MNRLVLIDGNAIVHRAYHALPPLHKTEDGQITNAVYGFFSMTLKIISDLAPDNLIVCFDRAAPTFRKQLYVGYQATRPKMEDDLSGQFEIIREVLAKIKVCVFELDGYEADDLIGTLANQAAKENKENQVVILTGDRDLLQLVNSQVLILAPIVGVTKMI
jgi:DNA polymerase-1